ncbi:predicted protein [Haemophilus influenzae NT127]|nr:predicted protein [Haemophilus influenzae NT127]
MGNSQDFRFLTFNGYVSQNLRTATSAPIQKLQKELNVLTKFNDPKGQYLYCLNCGKVQ